MIARLSGTLIEAGADHAVIDVGGVGYLVQLSARTLGQIGEPCTTVTLFTEMQVREDAMTLFAFGSVGERTAFRLLTGVQGVGGRVALAILSALAPEDLARAISAADKAMISRANGVGPKLAQRIILELKDKMASGLGIDPLGASGAALSPGAALKANGEGPVADALSALENLGFRPAEASAAVAAARAELGEEAALDALVRRALRLAAR